MFKSKTTCTSYYYDEEGRLKSRIVTRSFSDEDLDDEAEEELDLETLEEDPCVEENKIRVVDITPVVNAFVAACVSSLLRAVIRRILSKKKRGGAC